MHKRVASRWFEERYARLLTAMSLERAKQTLGFSPYTNPTPEEIKTAWKAKAFTNHPDRGGSHEKMVAVNVAKDVLLGNQRPTAYDDDNTPKPQPPPPPSAAKPQPPPPPPPAAKPKVKPYPKPSYGWDDFKTALAAAQSVLPAGIVWKLTSAAGNGKGNKPSYIWGAFGITEGTNPKAVFVGFLKEGYLKDTDDAFNFIWDIKAKVIPLHNDGLVSVGAKIMRFVTDFRSQNGPQMWPKTYNSTKGYSLREMLLKHSGGLPWPAALMKEGLIAEDDSAVQPVIRIWGVLDPARVVASQSKKMSTSAQFAYVYEWFIDINGKHAALLTPETAQNLAKNFFKKLFYIQSDHFKDRTDIALVVGPRSENMNAKLLNELIDCLTGEPSSFIIRLSTIMETWFNKSKTASVLGGDMTLEEAAFASGQTLLEASFA